MESGFTVIWIMDQILKYETNRDEYQVLLLKANQPTLYI